MDDTSPPRPLLPLMLVVFIGSLGFSIVLPFLVFLVLRLGGNAVAYAIVGATYAAFQLVGAPVLGRWSDRYGRRRILLLSHGGTLLSWLLFMVALALPVTPLAEVGGGAIGAFTLTVPLLLVFTARALDGLTGGNVSVANAYLADITSEDERSQMFGRMALVQNLGYVAGPAIAGIVGTGSFGELGPVAVATAVSAVSLVVIGARLPETVVCQWVDRARPESVAKVLGQEQRDCHEVHGQSRLSFATLLAMPRIAPLLAIHFLVFLAFNFFYVAFPVHAAIGPYSQAVRAGNLLFISGQIPLDPKTGQMVEGDIQTLTRRCMDSIVAILAEAQMTTANIVKTGIFLADMADFGAMNEVYGSYFREGIPPARAAVQPARLPKDARIEIEVIASAD